MIQVYVYYQLYDTNSAEIMYIFILTCIIEVYIFIHLFIHSFIITFYVVGRGVGCNQLAFLGKYSRRCSPVIFKRYSNPCAKVQQHAS